MTWYYNLKRISFLCIAILIFSCKDDSKTPKTDVSIIPDNSIKDTVMPAAQKAAVIGGYLDTLWTDRATFDKLPNSRYVFEITYRTNDTLTLHGWEAKGLLGHTFSPNPDIKLEKGHASPLSYGPDIYFGNMILHNNDIKEIKKRLKDNNAQYVLFAPQITDEHIWYKIFLSNDPPSIMVKGFAVIATGIDANPSPPKEY